MTLQLIIHRWKLDTVNQNVKSHSHMEIKFIPINHGDISRCIIRDAGSLCTISPRLVYDFRDFMV